MEISISLNLINNVMMVINYSILARSEEQVQGINVSLSTEFEEGGLPASVTFNASTNIVVNGQDVYMSMGGDYNLEFGLFSGLSNSSFPASFIVELENKIKEFFDSIKASRESMKFEFDIKKVDLVTLGGVDLRKTFKEKMKKNFEQFLGETIYNSTRDVELDDKCKAIHRGEKVEFNEREKELFERAVKAIEFEPGLIERKILKQVIKIDD